MMSYVSSNKKALSKMKRLSEKNLIEKIETIFRETKPASSTPDIISRHGKIFIHHGISFVLVDEGLNAYNDAVDEILRDEFFDDNFTRQYVERNIVQDFIASHYKSYRDGNLDIKVELNSIIRELRSFSDKYTVIIPIGGIKFDRKKSLKVGNVKIGRFRKKHFSPLKLKKISPIKSYIQGLEGKVVGVIEVKGESSKAMEKALLEVSRALNALRLYVRFFYYRSTDVQIRLMPQIMIGSIGPNLIDQKSNKVLCTGESAGSRPFVIDNKNLKKMRRFYFGEINSLLQSKRHELTPFEREILLSINWYGTAVDMTDPVLKFLNYAIVLEVLVSKQERDSDRTITDKLAEGIAFLLGKGYENRYKIKRKIKKLYRIRSSIVHGREESVDEQNLLLIEHVALTLILKLLKKRGLFRTNEELLDWIEEKRLR